MVDIITVDIDSNINRQQSTSFLGEIPNIKATKIGEKQNEEEGIDIPESFHRIPMPATPAPASCRFRPRS